jgi:hypothetical protein
LAKIPVYQTVGHSAGKHRGHGFVTSLFQGVQNAGEGIVGFSAGQNSITPQHLKIRFSRDNGVEGIGFVVHSTYQNSFHMGLLRRVFPRLYHADGRKATPDEKHIAKQK